MKLIESIPILLTLLMIGYILYSCSGENLTEDSIKYYKDQCCPIIQWLEKQNESEGRYPETLPQEYMDILDGFRPPSTYGTTDNGTTYEVAIGDYSDRFMFVLYYTGTNWNMDR